MLLQEAIDEYRVQRITDAQYLARVKDIMEKCATGKPKKHPTS